MRIPIVTVLLALVVAACGGADVDISGIPDLPPMDVAEFQAMLADDPRPAVVNVWASWCVPCRSEAPLLRAANSEFGDRVRFIGVNVQDTQEGAKAFIAEFGLDGFPHVFDPDRRIPSELGGIGVPITYFVAPGGELIDTHVGVIDERTLALGIDELLRRGGS